MPKAVRVKMTVEMMLRPKEIDDIDTLKQDLEGELVKIKSGMYENRFYGGITNVEISEVVTGSDARTKKTLR